MSEIAASEVEGAGGDIPPKTESKKKYRRDKPWDTGDIEKWNPLKIEPDDEIAPFLEKSSFSTLFPKYREVYLRESWSIVTSELSKLGIACKLNLVEGSMTVETTRKTRDPYAIFKARDLIKLLARSVPLQQALKILDDMIFCDIIKIGKIISNEERFIKRRQRLIGPNGNTLKALELLTKCYILVQGNTVASMGNFKDLKTVRRIVIDCINNVHPIYHIKELMIRRELEKDEKLKTESWARFLPHFRKSSQKRKKIPKKKDKSLFPPPQTPRKIDLQIESGEYFLTALQKKEFKKKEKKEKMSIALLKKREERQKALVPPKKDVKGSRESVYSKYDDGESKTQSSLGELKKKLTGGSVKKRKMDDCEKKLKDRERKHDSERKKKKREKGGMKVEKAGKRYYCDGHKILPKKLKVKATE